MERGLRQIGLRELQERLRSSGTARQLGFEIAKAARGRVVLRMRVKPSHKQVHGVVHGGVLAALADTAGGFASWTTASGSRVATIEMKINYLEAVEDGIILADARVIRSGRHIAAVDCDIRDEKRLVGKALMTFYVGPFNRRGSENAPKRRS